MLMKIIHEKQKADPNLHDGEVKEEAQDSREEAASIKVVAKCMRKTKHLKCFL